MKTIVQTHAISLKESLAFYKSLNFKVVSTKNPTIVTDGKVFIEINPSKCSRAGIKVFDDDLNNRMKAISKIAPCFQKEDGFITASPEGTWVYFTKPLDNAILESSNAPSSALGSFSGFTLETVSIDFSLKFWKMLGFKLVAGSSVDGWAQLSGLSGFGIAFMHPEMCPHSTINPSLTYFNGKANPEIIRNIKNLNR